VEIADRIARRYGCDLSELRSPNRRKDLVTLRKLIVAVLRGAGFSYPVIGRALDRDHSTLIQNQRKIEEAEKAGFGTAVPGMPWNADHPWLVDHP
jgi:chromosomal replication initiation ATPase DnaA